MNAAHGLWDWGRFLVALLKLAGALLLTLPIAWERARATRMMGLRTFPLVAMASCGYVLIASRAIGGTADLEGRIIQGLMTGIGFVGGGAILKEGANVRGTATAASIWMTGALGAAIAFSELEIAVLLSVLNFLVLRILTPIRERIDHPNNGGSPPQT
jgi:putative Mg2+ transporter-C (MgtC) family protein